MNLKQLDKLLRKARKERKTIVFNFAKNEVEYAGKNWIVIEEGKNK